MKKTPSYEEKFRQFQSLFLASYETYYVWKALQNEEHNELFSFNNGFWSAVIPALQHEWFIGLARLFEDSVLSKQGTVVSVYALIESHPNQSKVKEASEFFDKNHVVINSITRIRDHRHAHNNMNALMNPKDFEKRFPLKYSEVEDIFEFADRILSILHPEDGHGYMLDHLKEDGERHTKDVIEALRYFNKKRNEYREKWMENGNNYQFPPKE